MSKKKLVIAVDFNGTCVTYCYPEGTGEDIGAVLTPDMLQWSLGATIGIKFSKKFAIDKQAQKVSGKNLTVIDDEGETEQTNTAGQGGNTPSGELEG